jgi:putative ATP-binding cassette transporter
LLGFVALILAKTGGNALAQLALIHFSQRTLTSLCRDLSRRVLATPLLRLETLRASRVLTDVIDDVAVSGWAIQNVPTLTINLAVLTGCAVYLAWLSWRVLGPLLKAPSARPQGTGQDHWGH